MMIDFHYLEERKGEYHENKEAKREGNCQKFSLSFSLNALKAISDYKNFLPSFSPSFVYVLLKTLKMQK